MRRILVGVDEPERGWRPGDHILVDLPDGQFYLRQLARNPTDARSTAAWPDTEVSRAVAAALSAEIALLYDDGRRALEGAAVAGDPFVPELAAAAAALPEATMTAAIDELLRRDLIRPTDVPRRFRFRHPLVRHAVYDAAPGGWCLSAHERRAGARRRRCSGGGQNPSPRDVGPDR